MADQLIDYWRTHREIRFEEFEGKPGRIINARLLAWSDLLNGIVAIAKRYQLRAGIVSGCFGSLSKTKIRWEERTLEGPRDDKRSASPLPRRPDHLSVCPGKGGSSPARRTFDQHARGGGGYQRAGMGRASIPGREPDLSGHGRGSWGRGI